MRVVYAKQEPPLSWTHAIFLAGPTPRDPETPSWRPEALEMLEYLGYDGVVFVPEEADGQWKGSYTDQTEWEKMGLEMADRIVFWVPRDLVKMPAFTTNVEFGNYVRSGKAILGHPEGAPKTRYLDWLANDSDADCPVFHTLEHTLQEAIRGTATPLDPRSKGERYVPLDVWQTPMFQTWYAQLQGVGNRLDEAKVLWTFRMPKKRTVFSYVLWVKVWIAAEGRWKENEWIFSRTDTACVVLYAPSILQGMDDGPFDDLLDTEVVLVKEFRSPARTPDGFIHELPGGSCENADTSAKTSALREVHEETGLAIGADRLRYVGSRQALGILSTHHVHCYAAELSQAELEQAKKLADEGATFGEVEDTELTYVEVTTVRDLLRREDADWTTVGLVLRSLVSGYR